jgi:hypothetical protein
MSVLRRSLFIEESIFIDSSVERCEVVSEECVVFISWLPSAEARVDDVLTLGVTMMNDPVRREMKGIRSI